MDISSNTTLYNSKQMDEQSEIAIFFIHDTALTPFYY